MIQNIITQLTANLIAERHALIEFVSLLEQEQSLLIKGETDPLIGIAEKKTTDVIKLNTIAEVRHGLQKQLPPSGLYSTENKTHSTEGIQDWLSDYSPKFLAVWLEIVKLIDRARLLNSTNGELIQMKLKNNQQTLAVLSQSVNKMNLYGANGQTHFTQGQSRSLGSG